MQTVVNIDGRLFPPEEAKVSVFDHGFLFGDSIYETMHTHRRKVILLDRHLERLEISAEMLRLPLPRSREQFRQEILKAIDATGQTQECYVRLIVTRGPGKIHLDIDLSKASTFVIIVQPYEVLPAELYENGVKIAFIALRRNDRATLNPKIKAGNLLNNVLGYMQAKEQHAYEGLFCNMAGFVTECTSSNFFMVKGGKLITPPGDAGLLQGVIRGLVLELAAQRKIPAEERTFMPPECFEADEAFITSSLKGILPVNSIDEKRLSPVPGPVTKTLMNAYRDLLDSGAF